MLHSLQGLLAPAVMQRLTLFANHVIASEPTAAERLRLQAGRCIRLHLRDWPGLLPPPPLLAFRISRAGLLEWHADPESVPLADLEVELDARNPAALAARLIAGEAPAVDVKGDAALAADVDWLLANLRWDAEGDLARVIDPRVAHEVARAASALGRGLRGGLRWTERWRPGTP